MDIEEMQEEIANKIRELGYILTETYGDDTGIFLEQKTGEKIRVAVSKVV